jgi:hypothetical protein
VTESSARFASRAAKELRRELLVTPLPELGLVVRQSEKRRQRDRFELVRIRFPLSHGDQRFTTVRAEVTLQPAGRELRVGYFPVEQSHRMAHHALVLEREGEFPPPFERPVSGFECRLDNRVWVLGGDPGSEQRPDGHRHAERHDCSRDTADQSSPE